MTKVIHLPDDVHAVFRLHCLTRNKTIQDAAIEAVSAYMANDASNSGIASVAPVITVIRQPKPLQY